MTETLNYASPSLGHRWSRMAFSSLAFAILQIPFFFAAGYLITHFIPQLQTSEVATGMFFAPPILGLLFGLTAAVRGWHSGGKLRGGTLGLLASLICVGWPIAFVAYIIFLVGIC